MKAPDFTLPDAQGTLHSLKHYRGRWIILYFYPRDDTPGCIKEACSFRDLIGEYAKNKVAVLGISKDSPLSHKKFSDKYSLNFPLLSDPDASTIKAFGAWGPKKFMGREFFGTQRKTFLIDPKGNIRKSYDQVNVLSHADQMLADVQTFRNQNS